MHVKCHIYSMGKPQKSPKSLLCHHHRSLITVPPPDISQQEAGGEHGQEKAGQPDEGVQDPRQGGSRQLHYRSASPDWNHCREDGL